MNGTQMLMHKGEKVAECKFDSRGYLKAISKVYNEKKLPICVDLGGQSNPVLDLQRWILSRNIATNRRDIASRREFYGSAPFISETGISLFDCYWFSTEDKKDWEKINAYDNWDCKKDFLFLMLSYPDVPAIVDKSSPNLTIPGREQRIWYKANGELCILHGNAQKEMAEYKAAFGNPAVEERSYVVLVENIYAMKKAPTSKEVEMVSLEDMYNSCQNPSKSKMENLQVCCEKFGIPNWKDFVANMCEFDELVGNKNRELCDVGVLRDSTTLEAIGFAKL